MRVTPRVLLLAGIAMVSLGVVADTIPTPPISLNYFLGQAPKSPAFDATTAKSTAAAVEKPQAVNGALYAVIAPTYNGSGGTSSYIRLFNGGAATATFSITVVGSPSGTTLGIGNIQVPTRASPQKTMSDILTAANAGPLTGSDTSYSFYLQSTEPTAGYQHVTYNSGNGFFENVSSCTYNLNQTVRSVVNSVVATNIHTSLLSTYPAQVTIHNYLNAATAYTVTVIESATGVVKGTTSVTIGANASYTQPFSFFETAAGWTPTGGELHGNLVVTNPNGSPPAVLISPSIVNQTVQGALVSMSNACAVNAPVAAASSGGNAGGGVSDGGGISY